MGRWAQQHRRGGGGPAPGPALPHIDHIEAAAGTDLEVIYSEPIDTTALSGLIQIVGETSGCFGTLEDVGVTDDVVFLGVGPPWQAGEVASIATAPPGSVQNPDSGIVP